MSESRSGEKKGKSPRSLQPQKGMDRKEISEGNEKNAKKKKKKRASPEEDTPEKK